MTANEMALMANIAVDMQKNEVNEVLDKIRAEIATRYSECGIEDYDYASGLKYAMNVIDKYKAESEDKE